MLLLPALDPSPVPGHVCFADHAVSDRCYVLPAALSVAVKPDGSPDFLLLRYRDGAGTLAGGLLRTSLMWSPMSAAEVAAAAGRDLRPVSFERCQYRLTRRAVAGPAPAVGPWQAAMIGDQDVAVIALGLDADDEQLVQSLIEDGTDLLDVEVEGVYSGMVAPLPWLVTADRTHLIALLRALLGNQPATAAQIMAAFASLPQEPPAFDITALRPGAVRPDADRVATELGVRALTVLFEPVEAAGPTANGTPTAPTYRLGPTGTGRVAFDLLVPRVNRAAVNLTWSISALYASLTDEAGREAAFPTLVGLDPFEVVTIAVLCDVPFDQRWLQSVQVDLRHSSAQGVPVSSGMDFPAGGAVQRVQAVVPPGGGGVGLRWRPRATLAPPGGTGWPQVLIGAERVEAIPIVAVDRRALGMDFIRIDVDPSVFSLAAKVTVAVERPASGDVATQATLDAGSPSAWLALPGASPDDTLVATVTAVSATTLGLPAPPEPPDPPVPRAAVVLRSGPVVDRRIRVAVGDVASPLPDQISISLSIGAGDHFAYVAVTVASPGNDVETRPLEPGETVSLPVARASVFDAVRFRYQLSLVPYDATHATLPMVTTNWMAAEGTVLDLDPAPILSP